MGNAGLDVGISGSDENELFLLPFFDVTVDRIVYILKLINMDKIMGDLITYLRRDASNVAGGVDLDAVLYGRLLDLAHVDIPLDTFRRQDKSVVVRSLVAPGTRWTPQVCRGFFCFNLFVPKGIPQKVVVDFQLYAVCRRLPLHSKSWIVGLPYDL
ncbi:unnamed protein product [Strongylus vulgaris]|uniref:Uncharacterized protein n=1 Tax=Strongylus vulgaris TaxID=40348 RepID=A0A3P7IZQ6_STRVU|nr:unnamed protein product [Strongylus vulgaris]